MIYINNENKFNKFKNLSNYYVITDFDRTLTTKESEPTMGVIPQYLGGDCLIERTKIYEFYRPIELDYTMDEKTKKEIMKEWAVKSFTLLSKYATEKVIKDSIKNANIYLRNGAKEFLQEMNENKIPVIIMSSGIGNIAKAFLHKENCMFNNIEIVSNFFEFVDEKTYIDINNLMATSNKRYEKIPEDIRNKLKQKDKALIIGDLIEDINMADKDNLQNSLTIGFLDSDVDTNLEKYKNSFDILLTGNSNFNDIKNIFKEEKYGNKLV